MPFIALPFPSKTNLCFGGIVSALVCVLLIVCASSARAGHWTVSYNCQGQTIVYYDDFHFQRNPGPYTYPWTTTATTASFGASAPRYHIDSSTCSGSINAVLTWTHDSGTDTSLPPTKIYYSETASAGGNTIDLTEGPVSASDGLGDAATGDDSSQSSAGTHESMMDNTSQQTVVQLPQRSLSAQGGSEDNGASTSVNYSVTAYSFDIICNGMIVTGQSTSVMIGQGVSLSVAITSSNGSTGTYTYSWNPDSGTVAGFAFSNEYGSPIPLSTLNGLSSQSLHYYYYIQGSKSVQCNVSGFGIPITLNMTINATRPTGDNVTATPGNADCGTDNGGDVILRSGTPKNTQPPLQPGIFWQFTRGATGRFDWFQLITSLSVSVTNKAGENWVRGGVVLPACDLPVPYPIGIYPGYSTPCSDDSPSIGIYPFSVSGEAGDYAQSASVTESFQDWYMYKPNTDPQGNDINDAIYVPLGGMTWTWTGNMSGGHTDVAGNYGYNGPPWGSDKASSYTQNSSYPSWSVGSDHISWYKM